jgi:hypothetical protein
MSLSIDNIFETLSCLGGKKIKDSIVFLEPNLLIKHKETGIKYTVLTIKKLKKKKQPIVICYRYYKPKSNKKVYIKITPEDFDKFIPA